MQAGHGTAGKREVDFEIEFDSYRCIAVKYGREVTLFLRHEKALNNRFPGVVEALVQRIR